MCRLPEGCGATGVPKIEALGAIISFSLHAGASQWSRMLGDAWGKCRARRAYGEHGEHEELRIQWRGRGLFGRGARKGDVFAPEESIPGVRPGIPMLGSPMTQRVSLHFSVPKSCKYCRTFGLSEKTTCSTCSSPADGIWRVRVFPRGPRKARGQRGRREHGESTKSQVRTKE